jgi:hypothetical protein
MVVCRMSASLGVVVTDKCGGRLAKRLSDGRAAPSGVMVTHFTVIGWAACYARAGQGSLASRLRLDPGPL